MYQKSGIRINHISGFVNQISDIWQYHQNMGGEFVFYDRFFELCQRKGVTPTQVARDLGVRQSTVSMWKKQGTTPKYDTLKKLADYFGVETDDLYGVKPLPEGKVELNLDQSKKVVTVPSGALEFRAVNAFLKELGFLIRMDNSLLVKSNDEPKEAEAWIIADKRDKKVYLAKATDIDRLIDRILSFSKFEVYELLRRLTEAEHYKTIITPEPPGTPLASAGDTPGGRDTPAAQDAPEGAEEGE